MLNMTQKTTKTPIRQAAEDAVVVFAFTLVSALMALGWPPSMATVYLPLLSAMLIGLVTYARARDIALMASEIDRQDPTEEIPRLP